MAILLRIGLKNLRRHFRRSLITVCSIGFGLAVILWLQAILNGSNKNIIDTITSTYHGHLQIFRKDYLDDKMIQQTFTFNPDLVPVLKGSEVFYAPRVHLPALVSSGEQSMPVVLEGIDPSAEARITKIEKGLLAGKFLTAEPDGQCSMRNAYISKTLAKLLHVDLGQKIVLLAQAADGSLGNDLFHIVGIFDSGSPEYDRGVVVTTIPCVQAIGGLTGIHEVAFRIKGQGTPEDLQKAIRLRLPPELTALTWRELSPNLAAMTTFNDASLILVSIMLFIVISLGILNTFLIVVFERTKEFGVMMALGTPPASVIGSVLWEAFFLGVAASVMGITVAALVITYYSKVGYDLRPLVGDSLRAGSFQLDLMIYPVIDWMGSVKSTMLTLLVVVLATFYPAYRASRLNPAEAIRAQ